MSAQDALYEKVDVSDDLSAHLKQKHEEKEQNNESTRK